MIPEETRYCTGCKQILPIEQFPLRTVRGKKVIRGRCRSCHNSDSKNWQSINYHRHWANATILNHRKMGFTVNITREELTARAHKTPNCEYCGRELGWISGKKHISTHSPTLERIHNEQILTMQNTLIVCNGCNKAKGNLSLEEFVNMCRNITDKWGEHYPRRIT